VGGGTNPAKVEYQFQMFWGHHWTQLKSRERQRGNPRRSICQAKGMRFIEETATAQQDTINDGQPKRRKRKGKVLDGSRTSEGYVVGLDHSKNLLMKKRKGK